ncbi:hypothetical protein Ahy_Scaffold1g106909 [Arachis hypogaea]|uniref:Uncharacterized protein n=1 Tax=Arachis hypogaea TaxID=3818 RepID=A0A444WT32_ARAHY|nr:hypothetical protein Ahy_Scaffold1g106909 [Arachis hypogaea]
MSNVPISGASGSHASQQNFSHSINTGNNSAFNSTTSTVTRVENSRPVFPDMSRAMPVNQPSQTVGSLANIRQQMDESHHDLVNMLTHQMVTVLNPLLENTNTRIEQLNRQVNRIATVVNLEENDNQGLRFDNVNQNGGAIPNYDVHMPRHGQNTNDMLERLRQNNLGGNLARNVEQVLNCLGFNVGCLNRPYFVSAFPEYVQQAELPRGWKIPKSLTKFSGEENKFYSRAYCSIYC